MNIEQLIKYVSIHNKSIHTLFYDKCIKKLENHNKIINEIPENKYILEAIRVFLIYNKYHIYVCDSEIIKQLDNFKNSISYRCFSLSQKGVSNMLHQIFAIENNTLKFICNDYHNDHKYNINKPCLIISESIINEKSINEKNIIKIVNTEEVSNFMLGIESIKVLEHQDIKRFCNYIESASKSEYINKSTTMFDRFYQFYKTFDTEIKERMLIVSGSVLHSLGTTYTSDIDILFYGTGLTQDKIDKLESNLRNYNKESNDCDFYIIYNDKIISRESIGSYFYDWVFTKWPNLVGKENLAEVIVDPKHHFHFMGIKLMSIQLIIERLLLRGAPAAMVDLIMLKDINNYDSTPCFPNLSLRKGHMTIYNDREIDKKLYTIKKYFKEWHNIDKSIDNLKSHIKKCNELPHYIYSKKPDRNRYSSEVIKYHNMVSKSYIGKYFRNEKLLDIGAGPLRNIEYYKSIHIPLVVGIEPSADSIKEGVNYYKERKLNIGLKMIEGYGDESWSNSNSKHNDGNKYKDVIDNKPFKSILFKFTIHYMLRNINTVLENIKSVDTEGSTIIITCLDGNKVNEKLKQYNGRYEIIFGDEPLYGIYDMHNIEDGLKQIMVYFKGVYGVESGSIEYLVDINWLIKKFSTIGYKVIENRNFLDVNESSLLNIRNKLNGAQKRVAELHKIIILSKTNKQSNSILNENSYYEQYIKYKTKYLVQKYNFSTKI